MQTKVTIAIPTLSAKINVELVSILIHWAYNPNVKVKIIFYPNLAPLDNARNTAVKDFLESGDNYLCFIDDDIIPPINALEELLRADKDIIAPLCFTTRQSDNGLNYPVPVAHRYNKDKEYEIYYGEGIEETDTVTGGMHLVKREVYEKMVRPYAFTYDKNGIVINSEDFYFSQQCQKLGYKLFTHFRLPCKHIKEGDIKNFNDVLIKENYGR